MPVHDLGPTILDALRLALILSLPALGAALAIGTLVGLFQAATQLHEPSVNAIARLLAGGLALSLSARWVGAELVRFTTELWHNLPNLAP